MEQRVQDIKKSEKFPEKDIGGELPERIQSSGERGREHGSFSTDYQLIEVPFEIYHRYQI